MHNVNVAIFKDDSQGVCDYTKTKTIQAMTMLIE